LAARVAGVERRLRAADGDRGGEIAALRVAGEADAACHVRAAAGGAACAAAGAGAVM
jgi:hypothetical protein